MFKLWEVEMRCKCHRSCCLFTWHRADTYPLNEFSGLYLEYSTYKQSPLNSP